MIKQIREKISRKKIYLLLKNNKPIILITLLLVILSDILLIKGSSDFRLFSIVGIYIISTRLHKLKSRLTFLFCLGLLGIMFVEFVFTGASEAAEKAAVWLFFFLLIGIIQQFKE